MPATLPTRREPCAERIGPRLLLASRSPRRRELLSNASIPHDTIESHVDDGQLTPGDASASAWVAALSFLKARAAWDRLSPERRRGAVVMGADTIVHKDGRIIGQPCDEGDARRIISTLENGSHQVLTGVTLLAEDLPTDRLAGLGLSIESDTDASGARRAALVDTAQVRVGSIGPERLERYLASGHWRGKAGAYNLAERIADGWPIQYEGDPGTVMGLPMIRLAPALHVLLELDPQ
ncbi:MAG: Maf family protein [Phycisphaerales bacterium]